MSQSFDEDPAQHAVAPESSIPLKRIKHLGIAGVGAGVVLEAVAVATREPAIGWAGLVLIEFGGAAALGGHVGEREQTTAKL